MHCASVDDNSVQPQTPERESAVIASPPSAGHSAHLLGEDCPDNDDDSGAPDVVAHIIIRTVPDADSVANW